MWTIGAALIVLVVARFVSTYQRKRRPRIVSLEGLIGCGKTTQIHRLAQLRLPRVRIIEEPVYEWERHGFLRAAYEGLLNKAVFQHAVLMSLSSELLRALQDSNVDVIITERSPWSNRAVFALSNLSDEQEMRAYEYTFVKLMGALCAQPMDVDLVYLNASLPVARKRIKARGRASETSVDDAYLERLKDAHDALVSSPARAYPDASSHFDVPAVNLHTIDADRSPEEVFVDLQSLLASLGVASRRHCL